MNDSTFPLSHETKPLKTIRRARVVVQWTNAPQRTLRGIDALLKANERIRNAHREDTDKTPPNTES